MPKDLRNTLPREAKQRHWDDTLVQAYLGQAWGHTIKDKHYVALVAADEIEEVQSDPLVEKLRVGIVQPLDELIKKALRHCTAKRRASLQTK